MFNIRQSIIPLQIKNHRQPANIFYKIIFFNASHAAWNAVLESG